MTCQSARRGEATRDVLSPWELRKLLTPAYEHRRVTVVRPKPRPHFVPILAFVYRNRLAVASQIQRRFASVLPSRRTARRHLAEMEALGWLGVASAWGTGPLWPKVYFVTQKGARRLRDSLAASGKPGDVIRVERGRQLGRSAEHVLHEVWLTEFLLGVWQTAESRGDLALLQTERRSLAGHPAFDLGHRRTLEPDALFVYRERGGMMCCLVELDRGTMGPEQLKRKLHRYESWSHSIAGQRFLADLYRRHGAAEPKPMFRVLFVVADRQGNDPRRLATFAPLLAGFPALRRRVWLTTVSDLSAAGQTGLDKVLWHVSGVSVSDSQVNQRPLFGVPHSEACSTRRPQDC